MAIYRGTGGANEATDLATNQAVIAKQYAEDAASFATQANLTLDTFQDIYLGAFDTSPTVDNDSNALQVGALYFNSSDQLLRVWNGTNWLVSAVSEPSSFTRNTFSGTGSQTVFTLSSTPVNNDSVFVFISGVLTSAYNVSGTTLTFTSAPASGTNNILAIVASTVSTLAPADNSVSTVKLQNNAVTTAKLADSVINSAQLADNAVTTAKILNANVTLSKMASNSVDSTKIVDGSVGTSELATNAVTTSKITDSNVTSAKLASITSGATVGSSSQIPVITYNDKGQITASSTASLTITTATSDPTFTSTSATDVASPQWTHGAIKADLNAAGSAPLFACRAWCNFNGTLTGTNPPRAGGNVSSITRNSVGDYTINFTTALPDANYAVLGTTTGQSATDVTRIAVVKGVAGVPTLKTTTQLGISVGQTSAVALSDLSDVSIFIIR